MKCLDSDAMKLIMSSEDFNELMLEDDLMNT